MGMYECVECGEEYSDFPGIMLAVNLTIDPKNLTKTWPINFEEVIDTYIGGDYNNLSSAWEKFYSRLGNKHLLWFCSYRCAINFLANLEQGNK